MDLAPVKPTSLSSDTRHDRNGASFGISSAEGASKLFFPTTSPSVFFIFCYYYSYRVSLCMMDREQQL